MKWDCDARRLAREERHKKAFYDSLEWHDTFAWTPVKVGHRDCRWLEFVETRLDPCNRNNKYALKIWMRGGTLDWEYRAKFSGNSGPQHPIPAV